MADTNEQAQEQISKDIATQQEIYANNVEFIKMLCQKYLVMGQKMAAKDVIEDLKKEFYRLLQEIDSRAEAIEADEDQQLATLSAMKTDGPIKEQLVTMFEKQVADIDSKHSALVREFRNPQFQSLFERYLSL